MKEPPGFLEFWKLYPKKQARPKALAAWDKHKCEMLHYEIVEHVRKRVRDDAQWQGTKRYIPTPAVFLNEHRWMDEDYETVDDRRRQQEKSTFAGSNGSALDYPEVVRGVAGLLRQGYRDIDILRTFNISSSDLYTVKQRLRKGDEHERSDSDHSQ